MPKKTYVKKDNPMLVQFMIIVALAAVVIFIMTLKSTMPAQPTATPTPAPLEFDGTTTELNSVDIDQIDSGLDQLNTETSTF
ncbi:MAG: hypothetical protein UW26_C0012G0002 [Candidatus Collierbacteria bacterium GW2011_GWF1_44_12]|uniref:Uncharacterized protein n=2 Tax=Candidatus Collieribacteriota TaxID=1752725 RepID=A0A0G1S8C9_9BACT|nr:MAG: hypothetical protein UW26_C0012G0002 [Candidatus Collierbacteria bacterium GW2011_GWF1_44_12]KKU29580.1 MAG: hypothetical protein UX41_C0015G0014 [Candidatus Collierbacteria bacterium GW2011_GWE1_46_18]